MEYKFSHNNYQDEVKKRFAKLEEKHIDIPHNMSLLMVALAKRFGTFWEVGGSNL
jgi:hypothetical protein